MFNVSGNCIHERLPLVAIVSMTLISASLLSTVCHAQTKEELAKAREIDPELTDCILQADSMNAPEKEYWIQIMDQMRKDQLSELRDICFSERDKRESSSRRAQPLGRDRNSSPPPEHLAGYRLGMMLAEAKYLSKFPVKLEKVREGGTSKCRFETWLVEHPEFDTFKLSVYGGHIVKVYAKEKMVMTDRQVGQMAREAVSTYGEPETVACGFVAVPTIEDCAGRYYMGVHYRTGERRSKSERGLDVILWGDDYEEEIKFRGWPIEGEIPKGMALSLWEGQDYYSKLAEECGLGD